MAQHKVGDKILDDKEYDEHCDDFIVALVVIIGIIISSIVMIKFMPEEWDKTIRYSLLISSCGLVGFILSRIAHIVFILLYISFYLSVVGGILYGVWVFMD